MTKPKLFHYLLTLLIFVTGISAAADKTVPDTGVSGVYEVMIGTGDPELLIAHLQPFGFAKVGQAEFTADQAKALYGVDSPLTSIRLQNQQTDSHGLIRILHWHKLAGDGDGDGVRVPTGVGYAQPETIGQRMMVMRTKDIFRIYDIFSDARSSGERWLPTEPVYDDLYDMTGGKLNVLNRRIGVREMAVYGELFNLVLFQRYGYTIPGYGTIADASPLMTSEVTHNDFILGGHTKEDMHRQTDYYRDVLGFKPEGPVVLDGDWQAGPKKVFHMADGTSHWYRGFVSPNNISGKLKFFVNPDKRPDRSHLQKPGYAGITLHSVYTEKPEMIHALAGDHGISATPIQTNEFGEKAFVLRGPDGSSWQVLATPELDKPATTELKFEKTGR